MNHTSRSACISLAAVLLVSACAGCGDTKKELETIKNGSWLETTFSGLSDERKVGQVLCLTIDPMRYFLDDGYKLRIQGFMRKWLPGGIVFATEFSAFTDENIKEFNAVKLRSVAYELQGLSPVPLLVGAEFDAGAWLWDQTATRFPPPLALVAASSPAAAFREGKITGKETHAQGLNWIIGPSTMTASTDRPMTFVFGCFGGDPDSSAAYVREYVRGIGDTGVCVSLAWNDGSIEDIPDHHAPLMAGIDAGAQSVFMPPIDVTSETAQSVSIRKKLADQYGFHGLIVRKSHNVAKDLKPTDGALGRLAASFTDGQDMIILPDDPDSIEPLCDYIMTRVRLKKIDVRTLDQSVRSILALKEKLGLPSAHFNNDDVMSGIGVREYGQTSRDIISQSITLLRNDGGIVPFDSRGRFVLFVNFSDSLSTKELTRFSVETVKDRPELKMINVLNASDPRLLREVMRRTREADFVVCTLFFAPSPTGFESGLTHEQLSLISRIAGANRRTACISFVGPQPILDITTVPAFLACYGLTTDYTDSALDALFGHASITGKLPFNLSERFPSGYGIVSPAR